MHKAVRKQDAAKLIGKSIYAVKKDGTVGAAESCLSLTAKASRFERQRLYRLCCLICLPLEQLHTPTAEVMAMAEDTVSVVMAVTAAIRMEAEASSGNHAVKSGIHVNPHVLRLSRQTCGFFIF